MTGRHVAKKNTNPFRSATGVQQAQPATYGAFRSMTAAASKMDLSNKNEAEQFKKRRTGPTTAWQTEAWEYYDAIGEVKFAFNLVANIVSRIRLYPAIAINPSDVPISVDRHEDIDPLLASAAQNALSQLNSAFGGQPGLLRDAALNLLVTGECHLVQVPARFGSGVPETWDIRSVDELTYDSNKRAYMITPRGDSVGGGGGSNLPDGAFYLPENAFVGRVWRSHPRYSDDPDSSLKGVLDLCAELLLLNKSFRAIERSRLNAGVLFIPDGFSTAANPDPAFTEGDDFEEPTAEEEADQFEEDLIQALITPIEDESSASAVVPLLLRGPTDQGEKIKHITFKREYDETMIKRAQTVLDRILQGLDVPKDSITGLSDVRYSNAIQIDESLYKAHIEPLLLLLSDALTAVYLRPMLRNLGYDEDVVSQMVVWYDPSSVATRNDRASDADMGYDKGLISGQTWRASRGFTEQDAPTANEVALRMLMDKGTLTPEFYENLFQIVAPEIAQAVRATQQAGSTAAVPGQVSDILNGGPGAAPATDPTTGEPVPGSEVPAEGAVAPGEDAPPFALAEPTDDPAAAPEEEPAPEAVDTEDEEQVN